ncbi:MAG: serine/threonine-protein kinase, partial [Myxococcota bacterium]
KSMPTCPQCGFSVPGEAMFCPSCGYSMQLSEEETETSWEGRVLNQKYRLIEELAEGGMATVYKAQHIFLEDLCAVKIVKRSLSSKEEMLKRFQREARLTRQVSRRSPFVISVHDFGMDDEVGFFYVMELLDGYPMTDLLQDIEEPPALSKTIRFFCQILDAFAAVHDEGLIHRDIKPDNIFIHRDAKTKEEIPKLLDFGIARSTERSTTMLTNYGSVMGTPEYMSPEQCQGPTPEQYERGESHLDHRADIYALGVLLYQCLTGDVPFVVPDEGGTMSIHRVMAAHVMEKPVPPTQKRPDLRIPQSISEIALKALEKEPQHRFQSCLAFRDAILQAFPEVARALGEHQSQVQKRHLLMPAASEVAIAPIDTDTGAGGRIPEDFTKTAMDKKLPDDVLKAAKEWAVRSATPAPATGPVQGRTFEAGVSKEGYEDTHYIQVSEHTRQTDLDMAQTITSPLDPELARELRESYLGSTQSTEEPVQKAGISLLTGLLLMLFVAGTAYGIYFFFLR